MAFCLFGSTFLNFKKYTFTRRKTEQCRKGNIRERGFVLLFQLFETANYSFLVVSYPPSSFFVVWLNYYYKKGAEMTEHFQNYNENMLNTFTTRVMLFKRRRELDGVAAVTAFATSYNLSKKRSSGGSSSVRPLRFLVSHTILCAREPSSSGSCTIVCQ